MLELTKDEREAKAWALNQNFPSVAARYAKTLAETVDRMQAEIAANEAAIQQGMKILEKWENHVGGQKIHIERRRASAYLPEAEHRNLLDGMNIDNESKRFREAHGGGHGSIHA